MKRTTITKFAFLILAIASLSFSCTDKDEDPVKDTNTVNSEDASAAWGKVMAGNDPDEITWPDLSENYWFYPMDIQGNPNVGLRIRGQYPNVNTRFFNISLYNDQTTARLGSIEDFNILPNANNQNPFEKEGVTGKNYFEVNIVPEGANGVGLSNVITFPASTKKLSLLLRIYFNSLDHAPDFGGVPVPELIFFDLTTGKDIKAAERTTSNYYSYFAMVAKSIPVLKKQPVMAFTLAPNVAYSNGPTGYVSAANRIQKGEALCFRFIPPTTPTSIADNRTADVRYWSVCVGDTTTHTPITIPDRIVKKDGEYVNFVIVTKNDPNLAAIKANTAVYSKINLIEWDIEKWGEPMMVFYRQMFIKEGFTYSVQNLAAYPPLNGIGIPDQSLQPQPNDNNLAHKKLGQNGPVGYVFGPDLGTINPSFAAMNSSAVLASPTFNTATIRVGL